MQKIVLLVEDNSGDVRLMREAFRDAENSIDLRVVSDGEEAISFLKRVGAYSLAPRPDFILLDLNLPKMDGREVLARIKEDADLHTIPTVVLTTSEAEEDVLKSYELSANCYLSKPIALEAFESLIKNLSEFWLSSVKLPQKV
jgi:chemotaxis family two-component system response regulator Rcp1